MLLTDMGLCVDVQGDGFIFTDAALHWGTVYTEIKDPSVENPEFKGSPFWAQSRSVYFIAMHAMPTARVSS